MAEVLYQEEIDFDGKPCMFHVYQSKVSFIGAKEKSYSWDEVVGTSSHSDFIKVLCYPLGKNRTLVTHTITSPALTFISSIITSMSRSGQMPSSPLPQKNFLILINPFSGRKKAIKVWKQFSPFFEVVNTDIRFTEYSGHALEIISNISPGTYDAIITVSGDGLLHEVVNVLCKDEKLRNIPIGIIPAGTSNGLAQYLCACINEPVTPSTCAYICIKGKKVSMDVSEIRFDTGKIVYSYLLLTWGLIADVDLESEGCRCCGSFRNDLFAVWRILKLRRYNAKLTWEGEGPMERTGFFTVFVSSNLPYMGENMKVAPLAMRDDGQNDLLYLGDVGRWVLTRAILKYGSGGHINMPHVNYYKASTWSLAPTNGIFSIDGEPYEARPILVKVLPSYISLISLN